MAKEKWEREHDAERRWTNDLKTYEEEQTRISTERRPSRGCDEAREKNQER